MSDKDAIDLRSDTVTRPSDEMRRAAAEATVGDDVYGEDPIVNELQNRAAELLGMEASLYLPSGTMANQAAVRVHVDRGQEVLCDTWSHVFNYEASGVAQHATAQIRPLDGGERGTPTPEQIEGAYVEPGSHHAPGTGLLVLENTHNHRGGLAVSPARIDDAAEAAQDLGLAVHLDGARLWNAAVAQDVPVDRFTRNVDSVMVALSKGLGAPVGSILAGSETFIEHAKDVRKLFGGGMRQAGIIAAPGLAGLSNVDRLVEDHEHARVLADGLSEIDGLDVLSPETNIVIANVSGLGMDVHEFGECAREAGVLVTSMGQYRARFVTHWDVTRQDAESAVEGIRSAVY